jgi:hypothetical protein
VSGSGSSPASIGCVRYAPPPRAATGAAGGYQLLLCPSPPTRSPTPAPSPFFSSLVPSCSYCSSLSFCFCFCDLIKSKEATSSK